MQRVEFRRRGFRFDLLLTGRYTVVVGDSGTGKTLLTELADIQFHEPEYGTVSGAYKSIAALTRNTWDEAVRSDADIVVVDEDVMLDATHSSKVLDFLREYDHHYILMFRSRLEELPFGVDDVFELEHVSEKHIRMVSYGLRGKLTREAMNPVPAILCEDAKSGFFAAQKVYEGMGVNIKHADGKSNILSYGWGTGYVAADLCGLGADALSLELYINVNKDVQFCDIVSFEAEVLRAQGISLDVPVSYLGNVEHYYTELLQKFLYEYGNREYSKGDESYAHALITGFDRHSKLKLIGYRVTSGWWVPGVRLQSTETEGELQFLVFYRAVYGKDFVGTVPDTVKSMSALDVHDNFLAILSELNLL